MANARIGWILIVVGLLVMNYGYLHDKFWQDHNGFIVMGIKSYSVVVLGVLIVVVGSVFRGRGR